jgi:hypothetical protein
MASPKTPDFAKILRRITLGFEAHGIPFIVIGGQAVLLHGEPRLTQDIDLTVALSPEDLPKVLNATAAAGLEPLLPDSAAFVRQTFVLPVEDTESGVRVDVIFSTTKFEAGAIERAVWITLDKVEIPFASAEDVILFKLFSGRARDLEDAEGVVKRSGRTLDWQYLRDWAAEFSQVEGRENLPAQVDYLEEEVDIS